MTIVENNTPKSSFVSRNTVRTQEGLSELEKEIAELEKENVGEPAPEVVEEPKDPPATSKEEETYKKRYGDLRKHQQKREKELQDELEALKGQVEGLKTKTLTLPKTEEEVRAWVKKYPDVAAIVEQIADNKAKQRAGEVSTRMAELEELSFTTKQEKALMDLKRLHPDFDEISDDSNFHEWLEGAPEWAQSSIYDGLDVRGADATIKLYKVEKGIKVKNPERDAATSVKAQGRAEVKTKDGVRFSESQVQKMSVQEYSKNEEAIMQAMQNGQFEYDISGGAR